MQRAHWLREAEGERLPELQTACATGSVPARSAPWRSGTSIGITSRSPSGPTSDGFRRPERRRPFEEAPPVLRREARETSEDALSWEVCEPTLRGVAESEESGAPTLASGVVESVSGGGAAACECRAGCRGRRGGR